MVICSCKSGVFFGRPVFFFNDTATTEIYTLSLHDALPIFDHQRRGPDGAACMPGVQHPRACPPCMHADRKSTRLNSSHANISYAVFCLKKKEEVPATRHNGLKVEYGLPPRKTDGVPRARQA